MPSNTRQATAPSWAKASHIAAVDTAEHFVLIEAERDMGAGAGKIHEGEDVALAAERSFDDAFGMRQHLFDQRIVGQPPADPAFHVGLMGQHGAFAVDHQHHRSGPRRQCTGNFG